MTGDEGPFTSPARVLAVGLIGSPDAGRFARALAAAGLTVCEFSSRPAAHNDPFSTADESALPPAGSLDTARLLGMDVLIAFVSPRVTPAGTDLGPVTAVARAVRSGLRAGQLVVVVGVVPPGTVRSIVLPILADSGLSAGRDFLLAYSPDPEESPGVVSGFDAPSADAAGTLFRRINTSIVRVSSLETAEVYGTVGAMARAIQTAAANELRVACGRMGVDAWEVATARGTPPLEPALSSEPVPQLLSWGARRWGASFRLLDVAAEINAAMPAYVISKVSDALNDAGLAVRDSKVAILGMAYKKDMDDPRESPSFELLDHLLKKGARVSYNDPHIPSLPRIRHRPQLDSTESQPLTAEYLAAQDCVLIATDHTAYDYAFVVAHSKLVIDTRNATKAVTEGREKIVRV